MVKIMKFRVNVEKLILYFILIPFLYPRGFQEYFSWYKSFFTFWLVLAIAVFLLKSFVIYSQNQIYVKKCTVFMLLYFFVLLIVTVLSQGTITQGLQKIFIAPILCVICSVYLKKDPKIFIECVGELLLLDFILNISVFNPVFWGDYFNVNKHMIFLGHVQVASQLGVLGIFDSGLLFYSQEKFKSKSLLLFSIITMLMSKTAASYVSLFIIIFFIMIIVLQKRRTFLFLKPFQFFIFFVLLNGIIIELANIFSTGEFAIFLTKITSGRTIIWREASKMISNHWLDGYGAYGAQIHVFWSQWTGNQSGMNYAHNEIIQVLLDGGILLLLSFLIFMYSYIKNIRKVNNLMLRYCSYVILTALCIIMLFESVTEYYYSFIIISFCAYLPEIETSITKGRNIWEWYQK